MSIGALIKVFGIMIILIGTFNFDSYGQKTRIKDPHINKEFGLKQIKSKYYFGLNRFVKIRFAKSKMKIDTEGRCTFLKTRMLLFKLEFQEVKYLDSLILEEKVFSIKRGDTIYESTTNNYFDDKGRKILTVTRFYDDFNSTDSFINVYNDDLLTQIHGNYMPEFSFYKNSYQHFCYFYDSNDLLINETWKGNGNSQYDFKRYNYYKDGHLTKIIDSFENITQSKSYSFKYNQKSGKNIYEIVEDSSQKVIYHFEYDSTNFARTISYDKSWADVEENYVKYNNRNIRKYICTKQTYNDRLIKNIIQMARYKYSYYNI